MAEIEALCGDEVEAALDAFEETCGAAGIDICEFGGLLCHATTFVRWPDLKIAVDSTTSDSSPTESSSGDVTVIQTSTYYDSSCSCSKTVALPVDEEPSQPSHHVRRACPAWNESEKLGVESLLGKGSPTRNAGSLGTSSSSHGGIAGSSSANHLVSIC